MSYNGSGTFNINSTGQPVVAGTVITASAFNALTADLATGLTTAITKDGQTTTTAQIPFAQGLRSTLVTDSSSVSTGSIITDGGMGVAKNLYVGGTLNVTGSTSLTNPVINNIKMGYSTTATAGGSTSLTVSSNYRQFFTGTLAQTIVLPVTSTLVTGMAYEIENNSTGLLTVNSSGGNLVGTIPAGVCAHAVCIGTTLTTAADWDWDYISNTTITGTGSAVLGTSPTITTPTISSLSSAAATALTLQSAGTTAVTIDTSQNVGVGVTPSSGTGWANNLEMLSTSNIVNQGTDFSVGTNWYYNSGYKYKTTAAVTNIYQKAGTIQFQYAASGTAGSALTFSESMRIDSSGNLLVGTTSTPSGATGSIVANNASYIGANKVVNWTKTNSSNNVTTATVVFQTTSSWWTNYISFTVSCVQANSANNFAASYLYQIATLDGSSGSPRNVIAQGDTAQFSISVSGNSGTGSQTWTVSVTGPATVNRMILTLEAGSGLGVNATA